MKTLLLRACTGSCGVLAAVAMFCALTVGCAAPKSPPQATPPSPAAAPENTMIAADNESTDAPAPAPPLEPTYAQAPTQRRNGDGNWIAPSGVAHLVPRTQWPIRDAYADLIYEADNRGMRRDPDPSGTYPFTGLELAERWRAWGRAVKGVFLLRDSLWNQQDHLGRHDPVALMLSPSWVTLAVYEVWKGRAVPRLGIPADPSDDTAWAALTPEDLFGPIPPSETLHTWATQTRLNTDAVSAERIRATRSALGVLDAYLAELSEAAADGPEAVAARGAEIISRSDREYFTPELRRDVFIPLLVENPYRRELHDEGKSFLVSGVDVPQELVAMTRTTVLRRRLADGDIAIERYDVSEEAAIAHLVDVLQSIVPEGEVGNTVWVWVTGPIEEAGQASAGPHAAAQRASYDPKAPYRIGWLGEPSLAHRDALQNALQSASPNLDRVRIVTRAPDALDAKTPLDVLAHDIRAYGEAGWALRVNMRSAVLAKRLAHPEQEVTPDHPPEVVEP